MDLNIVQSIIILTALAATVLVPIALIRLIGRDGYGTLPADARSDWGTPTVPSRPYAARL